MAMREASANHGLHSRIAKHDVGPPLWTGWMVDPLEGWFECKVKWPYGPESTVYVVVHPTSGP